MSDSPVTRSNSEGSAFSGLFTRVELQRDTNQVMALVPRHLGTRSFKSEASSCVRTQELGRHFSLRQFIKHLARAEQRAIQEEAKQRQCLAGAWRGTYDEDPELTE